MESLNLLILFLICITGASNLASASLSSRHHHHTTSFIRTNCRTTLYPALCEVSLSVYARSVRHSPRNLAHAALSLSFSRALSASSAFMLSSSSSFKSTHTSLSHSDCMQTLKDSVDRLRRAVKELKRPGRYGTARYRWHLSNVQTWVSAALTDQSMCLDSLKEDVEFRRTILQAAQVTSNALALVNHLQGPN